MSVKTGNLENYMKLCKIMQDNLLLFSLQATEAILDAVEQLWWGVFATEVNS